jgi:hypothetical protein
MLQQRLDTRRRTQVARREYFAYAEKSALLYNGPEST